MTNAQNSGAVELLPCPFCGGSKFHRNTKAKSYFVKRQAERDKRDTSNYIIRCTKCGAKGPLKHSEADAEAAWNTRSTPAPSDQAGWQDIALAPFNELVWCFEPHDMGGFMFAGGKNNGGNWYNNLDDKRQYPTHWMPLPTAPTLTAGEGGGDE